jgi:beta-mannosidase
MANQVKEVFGCIPEDIESFVLASQISQAEAKKFFIEYTRARKWATSGLIWWNVLDGWPQFSDAIVDYYFSKKLAYHYIWRSQRPVLVMLGEPGSGKYLPVIACNDTNQLMDVQYCVRDASSGKTVSEGAIHLPAGQTWQADRIRGYASDQRLFLLEWEVGGQHFGNHYLSGTPPFSLETYRDWMKQIAELPRAFEYQVK